jgi:2-methylcitrate dehydratase PrpD
LEQALVLAQFLAQTDFNDLPHLALQAGKRGLLDCLGTAIGGANSQAAHMAMQLIDQAGGTTQATLLARGKRASLRDAALFNATAAHALDYDDTLSAPTAMVALAVAEQRSLPGARVAEKLCARF